jgi:hypothetical protein
MKWNEFSSRDYKTHPNDLEIIEGYIHTAIIVAGDFNSYDHCDLLILVCLNGIYMQIVLVCMHKRSVYKYPR